MTDYTKRLWQWLGGPVAFHIVSVLACIYFAIAAIPSGGYWGALNSALMFFAIWMLGFNSNNKKASK